MPWLSQEPCADDELPGYLAEPRPPGVDVVRLRDLLASAHHGAHRLASALTEFSPPASVPAGWPRGVNSSGTMTWQVPQLSSGFLRLVNLPGSGLAAMLDEWWTAASDGNVVVVDRRFQLGEPHGARRAGWSMVGRVRRLPGVHWVPVTVDIWAYNERWTMLTMTPQARVLCSPRYFRIGHCVLDRLTAALAATSAAR